MSKKSEISVDFRPFQQPARPYANIVFPATLTAPAWYNPGQTI
jgi:hypothetical protein